MSDNERQALDDILADVERLQRLLHEQPLLALESPAIRYGGAALTELTTQIHWKIRSLLGGLAWNLSRN